MCTAQIAAELEGFVIARDWIQLHSIQKIVLVSAEEAGGIEEFFQWVDDSKIDYLLDESLKGDLGVRIPDVLLCSVHLAVKSEIDLDSAINSKHASIAVKYPQNYSRGIYTKCTDL